MSQPVLQAIAIHILPKFKDNQTMEFGQLIEYNKYLSSKIMQKMRQLDFLFFEEA